MELVSRRDRQRADTVRDIKDAARQVLVDQGPDGLALRAVARSVGMTAPGLYRYFDSREDLVEHVVADLYDELVAVLEEARDAAQESLYLDFPYLVPSGLLYAAACGVVAARAAERGMTKLARWGRPLAIAALAGAACDAVENIALLRVLDGHTDQPWPGIAFTFATAKFVLSSAAVLYAVIGFLLTLRRPASPSGTSPEPDPGAPARA